MAHEQGTITSFKYGNKYYGQAWAGSTSSGKRVKFDSYQRQYVGTDTEYAYDRKRANQFLIFNALVCLLMFFAMNYIQEGRGGYDDDNDATNKRSPLMGNNKTKNSLFGRKENKSNDDSSGIFGFLSSPSSSPKKEKKPWFGGGGNKKKNESQSDWGSSGLIGLSTSQL